MEPFPADGLISELLAMADHFNCPITPDQAAACLRYTKTLLAWNRKINLTRITGTEELLAKHLLDSLIPARWLPDQGRALDIASGTGAPAIPLQILRPQLHFVLVESLRKKASFLKVCIAELGLTVARVVESRWQDFVSSQAGVDHARFDLITMRAFKPSADLLSRVSETLLAEQGCFAFWAGPATPEADCRGLAETVPTLELLAIHGYHLPYNAGARQLVLWKRRNIEYRTTNFE